MTYQGYDNFRALAVDKVGEVTSFGFNVIGFIGDHTLAVAIIIIVLFLFYRIFIHPIMKAQDKLEREYWEEEEK